MFQRLKEDLISGCCLLLVYNTLSASIWGFRSTYRILDKGIHYVIHRQKLHCWRSKGTILIRSHCAAGISWPPNNHLLSDDPAPWKHLKWWKSFSSWAILNYCYSGTSQIIGPTETPSSPRCNVARLINNPYYLQFLSTVQSAPPCQYLSRASRTQ